MNVNVRDEGQIGVKDVSEPVPLEEKVYAVSKLSQTKQTLYFFFFHG